MLVHPTYTLINIQKHPKFDIFYDFLAECPACGAIIDRNQGCDHMTCSKCRCSFCYVCGKYDTAAPTNRGDCGPTCSTRK